MFSDKEAVTKHILSYTTGKDISPSCLSPHHVCLWPTHHQHWKWETVIQVFPAVPASDTLPNQGCLSWLPKKRRKSSHWVTITYPSFPFFKLSFSSLKCQLLASGPGERREVPVPMESLWGCVGWRVLTAQKKHTQAWSLSKQKLSFMASASRLYKFRT